MVTHSVIAYHNSPGAVHKVDFFTENWRRFIPVRTSDTICVEERLPDGDAGVLINRTHTYRDIYLPISAAEKRMFDAIDGRRTIDDITNGSSAHATRSFFERLWWHDQVVFDNSPHSKQTPTK